MSASSVRPAGGSLGRLASGASGRSRDGLRDWLLDRHLLAVESWPCVAVAGGGWPPVWLAVRSAGVEAEVVEVVGGGSYDLGGGCRWIAGVGLYLSADLGGLGEQAVVMDLAGAGDGEGAGAVGEVGGVGVESAAGGFPAHRDGVHRLAGRVQIAHDGVEVAVGGVGEVFGMQPRAHCGEVGGAGGQVAQRSEE